MTSRPRPVVPARLSPSSNRDETRAYVQERLVLYVRLTFWITWILIAFVIALYELYPAQRPHGSGVVLLVALSGQTVGALWYILAQRPGRSLEALYTIDAAHTILFGVQLGVAGYFAVHRYAAIYSALSFLVFTRTLIVPSSGARTMTVSGLAFVPLMIAGIGACIWAPERLDLPRLPFLVGVAVFSTVAVALATTGSRVIYGLRRQVREASQLGQYTLERKIGEGGMGTVYKARHAMLRRPTAIKLLPPDRHDASSLVRFEREVQTMSRLTHPNTVAVFDYGRSPDGVFYYAMEYLDGVDLETLVRHHGPQPAPRVVHILRQVCGALDEAHELGLIHRDVKPANIIFCRRGNIPDVAKVVDFGLVKQIAGSDDAARTKVIAGTPAYVSPEAVTAPETVGPHSDLYSLGATGYFLLTGKRVFEGATDIHVCTQHVTAAPVPPSQRTDRPIPEDLEALILACLAKEPRERPASARALRARLESLPSAELWNEAAALAWWREFEAVRKSSPLIPPGLLGATTVTVEVHERQDDGSN